MTWAIVCSAVKAWSLALTARLTTLGLAKGRRHCQEALLCTPRGLWASFSMQLPPIIHGVPPSMHSGKSCCKHEGMGEGKGFPTTADQQHHARGE
jgi:hypothetical protein